MCPALFIPVIILFYFLLVEQYKWPLKWPVSLENACWAAVVYCSRYPCTSLDSCLSATIKKFHSVSTSVPSHGPCCAIQHLVSSRVMSWPFSMLLMETVCSSTTLQMHYWLQWGWSVVDLDGKMSFHFAEDWIYLVSFCSYFINGCHLSRSWVSLSWIAVFKTLGLLTLEQKS